MKYKVIKRLYDPFESRRIFPGEFIEISQNNLKCYKGYIEIPKEKEEPTIEEKAKPKKKSGGK